jgi:hypothetical protein
VRGTGSVPQALSCDNARELIMEKVQGHTVETGVEARAGFRDRPVLVITAVSTVLAFIVLGGLWLGFFAH